MSKAEYHIKHLKQLSDAQVQAMHRWQDDPDIRHLINVHKTPEDFAKKQEWEELKSKLSSFSGQRYGIFVDESFVGEFNFVFDHPALLKKSPKSAWIGIGIGEKHARGKGLGQAAMEYLEKEVKNAGGARIELGVFEFNVVAKRLYEKLGYQKFTTIPEFTWWDGKLWSDHRFEKLLG